MRFLPLFFAPVQCNVRVAEEHLRRHPLFQLRHPEADRYSAQLPDGAGEHGFAQTLGDRNPALYVGAGKRHDELVPAEAADEIVGTEALLQPRVNLLQHGVPHLVTVIVVDALEEIDVDEHHAQAGCQGGSIGRPPTPAVRERPCGWGSP